MKLLTASLVALGLSVAACSNGSSTLSEPPAAPAADVVRTGSTATSNGPPPADQFTAVIDNPYFPLKPGTTHTYRGKTAEGTEVIVVHVTKRTRLIQGVRTVVVRDTVKLDGELIEDTFDWYAQDRRGNVWYFGEDTKEYENGKVTSTEGSWEAGKDGAVAGIVMEAHPKAGDAYRQEFYRGQAEDEAEVVSTNGEVTVPAGSYRDVVITFDFTRLDADSLENKYYARGVGAVLEVDIRAGGERTELIKVERP